MLSALLAVCGLREAAAATIHEYTAGTIARVEQYPGVAFRTPTGGPWGDLTFNWFVNESGDPRAAAFGTIFLLTELYDGTPSQLSPFTPGYVAKAEANGVGTEYVFDPSLVIQPGEMYYFYTNSFNEILGGGQDPGTILFTTDNGNDKFVSFTSVSPNFNLSGDPVPPRDVVPGAAVPEPSSISLVLGAAAFFAGLTLRTRSRAWVRPSIVVDKVIS